MVRVVSYPSAIADTLKTVNSKRKGENEGDVGEVATKEETIDKNQHPLLLIH